MPKLSIKHRAKPSPPWTVYLMAGLAICTALQDQFLVLLHSAPTPVSPVVDAWIGWIMKVGIFISAALALFLKAKDQFTHIPGTKFYEKKTTDIA